MRFGHHRRFVGGLATLVVVAMLAGGCGMSTETVRDSLPSSTTEASTTTTESTTTTTEAPSTTEGPTTTVSDTLLPPASTSSVPDLGGGELPAEVKNAFMQSCSQGLSSSVCSCIWDRIKDDLSIQDLLGAGSSGSLPADLQDKVSEAAVACASERSS